MNKSTRLSYRFFTRNGVGLFTLFVLLSLSACASWLPEAHKLDITQGNALKPELVEQLHAGMPKADVRALLGVPVLQDPFHDQRWDYIFRYLPGKDEAKQSRLTLFFKDDLLQRIDDSEYIDPDKILPPPTIETD